MAIYAQIHRIRMMSPDHGHKSFIRRDTHSMGIGITQRKKFDRSVLPHATRIVKAVLIAFVYDIFPALVAKYRRRGGHSSHR